MANLAGDITLSVDVTAEDVTESAEEIRGDLEEIFQGTYGQNVSDAFRNLLATGARLYDELDNILNRMGALEGVAVPTEQYSELENEFIRLNTQYAKLQERRRALEASGKINTREYAELEDRLNAVNNAARRVDQAMAAMRLAGTASIPGEATAEYDDLTQRLNQVTNRATVARDRLYAMQDAESVQNVSIFDRLGEGINNVAHGAAQATSNLAGMVGNAIRSKIKELGKSIANLGKHTRSSNNALEVGFKKFIRYGLGVRSIFALINKLRRALIEGIGNLAQYSEPFNQTISEFVSALETVKNAFATAFAPVLTTVLPILTALMNALIDAITVVGKFFAALKGQNTFIKAKHVNKDYAASLQKTSKSAGGASDSLNDAKESAEDLQRTIAGFDDVEILHENKPSGSGSSGSGGSGGGADVGDLDVGDMFETTGIESPIRDFANKIRELIANQDWVGLGTFLGEKINSIFAKAKDLISWQNVGNKITEVVTAITTTFNSLVDTIDWALIGSTIGEGINTIINTIDLLITQIDWGNLGKSISTGVNSLFSTVDWTKLGKTFADGLNSVFKFLYNTLKTFDWKQAAKSLMTALNSFISNVDWKTIGATFSEFIKGVLNFAGTAIKEFDWAGLGKAVLEFLLGIDWLGIIDTFYKTMSELWGMSIGTLVEALFKLLEVVVNTIIEWLDKLFAMSGPEIINGLKEGIVNAITGIGDWIKENIFEPFINGFKSAFGISSPSKVMKTMGTYIIQGLLAGITSVWSSITSFFKNGVKAISNFFKTFNWKAAGSEVIQKLHAGFNAVWNTVTSFFSNGVNAIKNKITGINWSGAGNTIVSKLHSGVTALWQSKLVSYITTGINNVKNKITSVNWSAAGSSIVNKLRSGISSNWSRISSYIATGINAIRSMFNSSSWSNIGLNICSGLASGIRAGWGWVTSSAYNLARSAYNSARRALGIRSPSKVFNELVGRMIPAGLAEGIEDNSNVAIKAVQNLSDTLTDTKIPQLQIPAVALGEIVPYETTKTIDSINETIKNLADVLKYNQSNVTKDELTAVLNSILPTMLQRYVSFYISDEQIARHANAGNSALDYRFNPVGR